MPVGTRGSVKGILPHLVRATGAQIVLGNTYHLLLRPGAETIERLGGLAEFTGWHGPMLTDSGGYQAYSLAATNAINEDGVTFKSIVDGSMVTMTPESAMDTQNRLGADIIMAFDDCPPSVDPAAGEVTQDRLHAAVRRDAAIAAPGAPPAEHVQTNPRTREESRPFPRARTKQYDHAARLRLANERTVRWLERCRTAHEEWGGGRGVQERSLFGIVQGGTDLDERAWSVERITNIELPGYAIGGVAVGESSGEIARVVAFAAPRMPESKPRYLMGVGYERDLVLAVLAGVDMFDCVLPTRNGRNANAFTSSGQIRLRNAQYSEDPGPIERGCDCIACVGAGEAGGSERPFSRAYIRHLFMAKEMLGPILVSLHNLRHFQRLMGEVRDTIRTDDWEGLVGRWPVASEGVVSAQRLGLLSARSV